MGLHKAADAGGDGRIVPLYSPQYTQYLGSSAWKLRRLDALAKAGYRCQRCQGDGSLEVHHLSYDNLGNEKPEDLQVLCHICHPKADEERRTNTRIQQASRLWAARVNGWASKRYGEDWHCRMDEGGVEEEFEQWLDAKGEE